MFASGVLRLAANRPARRAQPTDLIQRECETAPARLLTKRVRPTLRPHPEEPRCCAASRRMGRGPHDSPGDAKHRPETRQRVRAKRGPMINSDALLTMRITKRA
jgi:hypothetical protein